MSIRRLSCLSWRQLGTGVSAAIVASGTGIALCAEDKKGSVFDSEALERAAKAVKEINASPHAKKILEITKTQEATKVQELKTKEAEHLAAAQQYATQRERVQWEERKKAMQEDAQTKAELARYQDDLARKRIEVEHERNRQRNVELVQLQEESAQRQEAQRQQIEAQIQAERRETERYKAGLEKDVQREKALAEAEGRAKEARENEDVHRREQILRFEEERKKLVEAINVVFGNLGKGATALLTDKTQLTTAVLGIGVAALSIYAAREGVRVSGAAFDRYLGTPKLVRETSRGSWKLWDSKASRQPKSVEAVRRDFSDIVLPGELHDHVRALAAVTANTKRHGAPFRHMLFFGPPGTGKTLAAKRLARTSGLDYAIMSGGDVAPLGGGAVTQIHEMFDWAESSSKGLLLFIDEADAFLGQRGANMSEGMRGALNALLFRTGDQSRDFAVVLATNRPGDLDPAVVDRMDEALEFGLPGEQERVSILALYLDQYIVKAGTKEGGAGASSAAGFGERIKALLKWRKLSADRIEVEGVNSFHLAEAAKQTAGFSGRELAKLMASVQAAVYGGTSSILTPEIFKSVVAMKVKEHRQRTAFAQGKHEFVPSS